MPWSGRRAAATLNLPAPEARPSGAPLSPPPATIRAMATMYRVTYKILPAGVGPDDYEPADLEQRTELVEAADLEPAGEVDGTMRYYMPPDSEFHRALRDRLAPGDHPIILKLRLADDPED